MIVTLFKNQKYLFAIIFGGLLIISIGWYFLIQKDLSIENEKYRKEKRSLSKKINKFKSMESQINRLESDWHEINDEFEMVLEKIPDKRLYEEVTDFLYSMIINQGLKIKNFSPSSAAIDKKDIRLPESGIDIMIEKFPIDISLNGSFIDFGQLIESMATGRYRLTASNIEINQKQNSSIQSIKFISYAYFQSQTNEPVAKTNRKTIKKRSTKEARKAETAENKKDIAAVVDDKIKKEINVPVLTDIHNEEQCKIVSNHVDVLQIPAFLCRQTDLLIAAAKTNKIINVKKGQFLAPWDMVNVTKKISDSGNNNILVTERGASFGYNTLVSDMRSIPIMAKNGYPVIFDATHSVQQPGGMGEKSGGQREFVEHLSRAAIAVGVAGVFIETHQDPDNAPSDGPNMLPLNKLENLISQLCEIDNLIKK